MLIATMFETIVFNLWTSALRNDSTDLSMLQKFLIQTTESAGLLVKPVAPMLGSW